MGQPRPCLLLSCTSLQALAMRMWRSAHALGAEEASRSAGCSCLQARQQLKEMVWMKSSENMVLEAMFRLSGLHDALEDLLRAPVVPHGPSRYDSCPSLHLVSAIESTSIHAAGNGLVPIEAFRLMNIRLSISEVLGAATGP